MATRDYESRTETNVIDSDATVVFTKGRPTGSSLLTIQFCRQHRRPYLHLALDQMTHAKAVAEIVEWLKASEHDYENYKPRMPANIVLNVAGSRESKFPGLQESVQRVMVDVVRSVNSE